MNSPALLDAKRMSAAVGIAPCELAEVSGGFSGAEVFCASISGGRSFAIRRWPAGTDRSRIETLHQVIRALREAGLDQLASIFPVNSSLGVNNEEHLCRPTVACIGDRVWHVETWCSGRPNFCDSPSATKARVVGELLARAHLALTRIDTGEIRPLHKAFVPRPGGPPSMVERASLARRWTERLGGRFPCLSAGIETDAFDEIRGRLPAIKESLERESVTDHGHLPICLRDLWSESVLWTDEQITGLIDLSAARVDHPAGDIARLFGSLFSNNQTLWDAAFDAYESIVPLSPADHRLIRIYCESEVVLSTLNWIERLSTNTQRLRDSRLAAMRSRLAHYCNRVLSMRRSPALNCSLG